jgi:hypothetical protein
LGTVAGGLLKLTMLEKVHYDKKEKHYGSLLNSASLRYIVNRYVKLKLQELRREAMCADYGFTGSRYICINVHLGTLYAPQLGVILHTTCSDGLSFCSDE